MVIYFRRGQWTSIAAATHLSFALRQLSWLREEKQVDLPQTVIVARVKQLETKEEEGGCCSLRCCRQGGIFSQ